MKDETIVKMFTLGCAVVVTLCAMIMGHDGNLAAICVVGLFGGEKLLGKLLNRLKIE